MKRNINIRIDNFAFEPSTFGEGEKEGHYSVVKYQPNKYYGKESEYEWEGEWAKKSEYGRIHKSCFENPEWGYAIASIVFNKYNYKITLYNEDGFLNLSNLEVLQFRDMLKIGIEAYLKPEEYDQCWLI